MNSTGSYIDSLPVEILNKVILLIEDATPSLLLSQPFVACTKQLLKSVSLSPDGALKFDLGRGVIQWGTSQGNAADLEQVLYAVGDCVRRVEIAPPEDLVVGQPALTSVLMQCKHVVELEIFGEMADLEMTRLLKQYAHQLEVLEVPCSNVHQILRPVHVFPQLRVLLHFSGNLSMFSALWPVSGASLREVYFHIFDEYDFWLVDMHVRRYCPHLKRLMLYEEHGEHNIPYDPLVELFKAYNEQLVEVVLDHLGPTEIARIAFHCPNLRCTFTEENNGVSRIRAGGPIIETLYLGLNDVDVEDMIDLLAHYQNMTYLHLRDVIPIESVIVSPLRALTDLTLKSVPTESAIKVIERCTSRLKYLYIDCDDIDIDAAVFQPLAQEKFWTLRRVEIRDHWETRGRRDGLEWIRGLLDHFLLRLPHLEDTRLTVLSKTPKLDLLRSAVLPLRHRAVSHLLKFNDGELDSNDYQFQVNHQLR